MSRLDDSVLITGIGVVLPGTSDVEAFWKRICLGESQVRPLTRLDPRAERLPVRASGEIATFDHRSSLPDLPERHALKYSREILITMSAVAGAREDARVDLSTVDSRRVSVILSTSRGAQAWWQTTSAADRYTDSGAMLRGLASSPASLAAIHLGARGLVTTISAACVGGHHAIGHAVKDLRSGISDVAFAGGYEFPITGDILRCFLSMGDGVLSPDLDQPVRPYSVDRNGMVLGEGAVVLCLELASRAHARGKRGYAVVHGHGARNEAGHSMRMDLTGRPTAALIAEVLADIGRRPEDVGYFCGHGTATKANDLAECRALRNLYPQRRDSGLPPIGSNKPVFGHTLGAAGVVNVAATALMLHHQQLAPTIGVTQPDPECDVDHVADGPRPAEFDLAVSLTFAIGSQISVIALGATR
jgi:3-oxoacyl-[acyl-carrier-protein] synthase II